MKFLKNLFKKLNTATTDSVSSIETVSDSKSEYDKFLEFAEAKKSLMKESLKSKNLSSIEDLENLVKPLIKPASKIIVKEPIEPTENSQMKSHFGGQPFFQEGEEWPKSKRGNYLSFVFQIFNTGQNNLPNDIKLVQFYYDFEAFPWDTKDDGWLVKTYRSIDEKNVVKVMKPEELGDSKYCEVEFQELNSLPTWEGIHLHNPDASDLSCMINEDEPWGSYERTVTKLIGEQDYQSQLGGYPKWVQGEETPLKEDGSNMDLLFQIDSEDNAGLMWGDVGLIYVFYDDNSSKFGFILQCH